MSVEPECLGVVTLAALDVRRVPDHRAELGSQLLLGELVRILRRDRRGQWVRVQGLTDGYRGWVRTWGLREIDAAAGLSWRRRARARVCSAHALVRTGPGYGGIVTPVFWHARLVPGRRRNGWRGVELPDGRHGWIEARAIELVRPHRIALARLVRRLMGTPYLWGGRTPLGFDCSGFVQQVMAARNVSLPRDADDQRRAVRPLRPRERARVGDLVFFGPRRGRLTHVGIMVGKGLYAHARGMVRINSLEQGHVLYDNDLAAMLRGYGRWV